MNEYKMTLGSLFDGIAGFPLAAAQNGIKTIWASEIEPNCVDIAARHFPETKQQGDITKLNGADIDQVDIISFGSPCQNLSVAGNQRGLDGERSQLFFEAVRIIYEMRGATNGKYPKYIIWENVAGAFSSNKGQDFRRVLEEITKTYIPMPNSGKWAAAGMVRSGQGSTAWRTMDAQYWGVPQRRKRIYLIHSFGNERAGQILFECESVFWDIAQGRTKKKGTTKNIGRGIETADRKFVAGFIPLNGKKAGGVGYTEGKSPTITQNQPAVVYTTAEKRLRFAEAYQHHGYRLSDIANTQTAGANSRVRGDTSLVIENNAVCFDDFVQDKENGDWACMCKDCVNKYKIPERLLDETGQGICGVQGCNNEADYYIDFPETDTPQQGALKIPLEFLCGERTKYRVRRLTPTECERLDGFPDGWTSYGENGKEITDAARYTALGNSIAIPCASRVFAGIVAVERNSE